MWQELETSLTRQAVLEQAAVPALADVALPESELDLARTLVPPEDQGPKVVLDDEQPALVLDDAPPLLDDAPLPLAEAPAPPAAELPGLDDGMLLVDEVPALEVEIAPAELEEVPPTQLAETVEDLPEEVDVADLEEIEVEDAADEPAPAPPDDFPRAVAVTTSSAMLVATPPALAKSALKTAPKSSFFGPVTISGSTATPSLPAFGFTKFGSMIFRRPLGSDPLIGSFPT